MTVYTILNQNNGSFIADQVQLADQFLLRLKGLLGRKKLDEGEGLILYPCASIHCYGMKFSIDAVFLDKNKKVLNIIENIPPGGKASAKGAKYVLELKAGTAAQKQIEVGDVLIFV